MKPHISDHDLLQLMSAADSGNSTTSDTLVTHLEQCTECQHRMASLSGEGEWLAELKQVLHTSSTDGEVPTGPPSISIMLDGTHNPDEGVDATRLKLDFLESPRHPELLGRLGRYDIERMVGVGGFGIVFKAHDSELHRTVALKVLAPHLMTSGAARTRFAREAQAAAAIHHENVIPIFDVKAEEPVVYLVMPFIAGSSLQERVDRDGPLTVEETLRIGAQIAAGLAAAHNQAVVHRDVKPANVLLESSLDRVLISDFGLARTADDASLTRSGVITGTPHYMSPEQAMGESMDHRSDLFSLGSVLYFMCTGHPPFRAPQVLAVLNQISRKTPRSIESVRTDVPFELQDLISRLLNKSPSRRYASASEVCHELTRLLNAHQNGRLRRRKPSVVRYSKSFALPAGALLLAMLLGYGIYQNEFGDPFWVPKVAVPAVDTVPREPRPTDANHAPEWYSDLDPAVLDDTFDAIVAETTTLLDDAEEWATNDHIFSTGPDQFWDRTMRAAENETSEAETLFDDTRQIPNF